MTLIEEFLAPLSPSVIATIAGSPGLELEADPLETTCTFTPPDLVLCTRVLVVCASTFKFDASALFRNLLRVF